MGSGWLQNPKWQSPGPVIIWRGILNSRNIIEYPLTASAALAKISEPGALHAAARLALGAEGGEERARLLAAQGAAMCVKRGDADWLRKIRSDFPAFGCDLDKFVIPPSKGDDKSKEEK